VGWFQVFCDVTLCCLLSILRRLEGTELNWNVSFLKIHFKWQYLYLTLTIVCATLPRHLFSIFCVSLQASFLHNKISFWKPLLGRREYPVGGRKMKFYTSGDTRYLLEDQMLFSVVHVTGNFWLLSVHLHVKLGRASSYFMPISLDHATQPLLH
jgi:hypothetical protein